MASSNVSWGIDVGAGAVKAIKLEKQADESLRVEDFVVVPHKRVLSTPDVSEEESIRVALGAFMSEYRDAMRGASVAVSVPGHAAFARFAKLPPVEPKGVMNLVKFEAVQQIPFPIEEVEWDHQIFASEDSPEVEVGIFAITKERVNERLSLSAEVGLSPDLLTLGPVAAYNAIAYDLSFTESTPGTVIVDIGATATDLIVAEQGRVWIRTFPLGGHHFTEALAETFKLTYTKAEKLKREAETSKYKKHVFQALKPVLADFVQDVQRSIGYYQDTHPDAKIERLIGLGSTFKLLGLRKSLQQQLKVEVYRLEGFKRISVDGPGEADFEAASVNMATAYGLALQGLGQTPIRANLMPTSVLREGMWKKKTPWFVAAACMGLIGAGLTFVRPFFDQAEYQEGSIARDSRVSQVVSRGEQFKREWSEIESRTEATFPVENVALLTARRGLLLDVTRSVEDLLGFAREVAGRPEFGVSGVELRRLGVSYVPPGGAVNVGTRGRGADAADGGGGGDPFGGGGRDGGGRDPFGGGGGGAGDGAGGGTTAGEFGALEVVLTVDVGAGGAMTFFNDSVLEWLRRGVDSTVFPFELMATPTIEDVTVRPIEGGEGGDEPRRRTSPMTGGGDRDRRIGGGAMGGGMGGPGGTSGGEREGALDLSSMAPLPDVGGSGGVESGERYTVRFALQLLEEPREAGAGVVEGESGSAGEGDGGRS